MSTDTAPAAASRSWEAQYEKDFAAQTSSGPITFTEEQRRKNKEVLSRVSDLLPFEDAYKASDCDLIYRFLIGRHWSVANAEKGLRGYIALRKKERLNTIVGEQLHPIIMSVLSPCFSNGVPCPLYGIDRDGLPVMWMVLDMIKATSALKQFTETELLRGQMRAMELGRFVCRTGNVDRCTYVIDFGGITMSTLTKAAINFVRAALNISQVIYPEIMRRMFVFNTGWAVSAVWKVLRPMIDVRVQEKIKFERGPATVASLQRYMAPEQVHPVFGGTGKSNIFDPIVDAEIERIRSAAAVPAEPASSPSSAAGAAVPPPGTATPPAGAAAAGEDSGLFNVELRTMYGAHPFSPHTVCLTPAEDGRPRVSAVSPIEMLDVEDEGDRMVIGAPRVVSAWMASLGAECDIEDAMNSSQSASSSSAEYVVKSAEAEEAAWAASGGAYKPIPLPSPNSHGGRAGDGFMTANESNSHNGRPTISCELNQHSLSHEDNGYIQNAQLTDSSEEQGLAPACVTMALKFGADGSITGYCNAQCVGRYRSGRFYASPLNNEVDLDSHGPAVGELLFEAGHPVHDFLIVCDGQRNARYILRRSREHVRLTVYNVVGAATVHTEKNNRHFVQGQRVPMAVALPHAGSGGWVGSENWMLCGEDVTERSRNPILRLFSPKSRRSSTSAVTPLSPKEKGRGWPSSVLSSFRSRRSGERSLPVPGTPSSQGSGQGGAGKDFATAESTMRCGHDTGVSCTPNSQNDANQLLADSNDNTVRFFHLLAGNPASDLFALAVAITLSLHNDLEGSKRLSPKFRLSCR